jgi:dihydrofolate reductase
MRKVIVFNNVSLDGYFSGPNGDIAWMKSARDPEWDAFALSNARSGGEVLLGRVTYDLMAGWWPTPMAHEQDPELAALMNRLPKIVFSRTMTMATWSNTRVANGDPADEVRRLKDAKGPDMVILGSGTIVALLERAGLIDEYQVVVHPVVLGRGRTMFEGLEHQSDLRLSRARVFGNGNMLGCYERGA